MGTYYSLDLRERAVAAYRSGESCRSVGARYSIAPSTVVKWSARLERTGDLKHGKVGGHRARMLAPHRDFIRAQLKQTPHLTLHKLVDLLAARGVRVSHDTVWRFIRTQGFSHKKKPVRG